MKETKTISNLLFVEQVLTTRKHFRYTKMQILGTFKYFSISRGNAAVLGNLSEGNHVEEFIHACNLLTNIINVKLSEGHKRGFHRQKIVPIFSLFL